MEKRPALVIMAAGMGSRFGGPKQITPVGPSGELIMDYSIYDALAAGFGRIVFVIKKEMEAAFRERIGDRIARHAPVAYVFQELDALPEGYTVPDGRTKPWGTGHAVLCCRDIVDEPFVVINADDYYGRECYRILYEFLTTTPSEDKLHIAMAGYKLENTLTENGSVSRGVCTVDASGMLTGLVERTRIELRDGKAAFTEDDGANWTVLPEGATVSMNCWAFPSGALDCFESKFRAFLDEKINVPKSEFYLPFAVDAMVAAGEADVKVLTTGDKWYGMTYAEDHALVIGAIAGMVKDGIYPERLWNA